MTRKTLSSFGIANMSVMFRPFLTLGTELRLCATTRSQQQGHPPPWWQQDRGRSGVHLQPMIRC